LPLVTALRSSSSNVTGYSLIARKSTTRSETTFQ
jgi:hypothetical protein